MRLNNLKRNGIIAIMLLQTIIIIVLAINSYSKEKCVYTNQDETNELLSETNFNYSCSLDEEKNGTSTYKYIEEYTVNIDGLVKKKTIIHKYTYSTVEDYDLNKKNIKTENGEQVKTNDSAKEIIIYMDAELTQDWWYYSMKKSLENSGFICQKKEY
jgi:hypothetical protein